MKSCILTSSSTVDESWRTTEVVCSGRLRKYCFVAKCGNSLIPAINTKRYTIYYVERQKGEHHDKKSN